MMNERDKALRKSRRTKVDSDISQYKLKRNAVNNAVRKAKSTYYKNLLKENSTDPNKFWKAVKSIYPTKVKNISPLQFFEIDGEKSTDSHKIANAFCSFFKNIVLRLKKEAFPLCDFVWRKPSLMPRKTSQIFKFRQVSTSEVERHLKFLKRNKSTGFDGLPPGMLKDARFVISSPLAYLINLSLETGIFPAEWKVAKIIPIHKSGSYSCFDNYRPISILPTLSKVLEKIIHRQLLTYLEKNDLILKSQFGFRPNLSTELAVTLLLDDIRKNVDDGNLVGAVFIDLSKAFDTISHSKLIWKLSQYGIDGYELEWFKDYLFNRLGYVHYNNGVSQEEEILSGVPQGSILGPLLFLIYFNDLDDVVHCANIIKYADDTILYLADKNLESIQNKLNKDIGAIADWFEENELIINLKKGKSETLLFGTAKRRAKETDSLSIFYRGVSILETKVYKYLGMEIDGSLNLNSHFEKCYKRASGRLRLLAKLRNCVDVKSALAIYQSMIVPIFTYCGILQLKLTETQLSRLLSFHDRAVKIVSMDSNANINVPSVVACNRKRACKFVRRCLDKDICSIFQEYFTVIDHSKATRNNAYLLRLPSIKTEYARKSFSFMGAKIYNTLPIELRRTEHFQVFEKLLDEHFDNH